MTLEQLNLYMDTLRQLRQARELRAALISAAEPGAQIITGMPHAPGYADKLGSLVPEIAEIDDEIQRLTLAAEEYRREITEFIRKIPDLRVRMIFRLRYLNALTWRETAAAAGGGNTEEAVKSACYRYLKSCAAVTPADA